MGCPSELESIIKKYSYIFTLYINMVHRMHQQAPFRIYKHINIPTYLYLCVPTYLCVCIYGKAFLHIYVYVSTCTYSHFGIFLSIGARVKLWQSRTSCLVCVLYTFVYVYVYVTYIYMYMYIYIYIEEN